VPFIIVKNLLSFRLTNLEAKVDAEKMYQKYVEKRNKNQIKDLRDLILPHVVIRI
jgi:hypothetical protein